MSPYITTRSSCAIVPLGGGLALELPVALDARRATEASRILVSAGLAWFGPFWMVPVAGIMYTFIGPLMWWHSSRVERKLRTVTPHAIEVA